MENHLTYVAQQTRLKSMSSLFVFIWTENAPPISVQIKTKRELTWAIAFFVLIWTDKLHPHFGWKNPSI